MAVEATSSTPPSSSPQVTIQRSPWHSPVPYLFGGLAAMLTLIAFALFILAYSYWKLSDETESRNDHERDIESENPYQESKPEYYKAQPVFEEKYFVVMAGHTKPTFLATPISSRVTSFGCNSDRSHSTANSELDIMES
ncbi:putative protein glutamine dumper [Helianthus annuus]|nr:putative protein glutamine dumper [Helianthus annuus]